MAHTEFGRVIGKKVYALKDPIGVTDGVANLLSVTKKYGAKVTLAVCPEVAHYVPKNVEAEIGLHIHPGWQLFEDKTKQIAWYVGDEWLRKNCKQSSDSTVLRDYPFIEQCDMIKAGRDRLLNFFGHFPCVFVAGRWSLNNQTIKALVNYGFTHDCSAVAGTKQGHYDWSRLPRICMPYMPSTYDYQAEGNLPFVIVPISQMVKGGNVNPEAARVYGVNWLKATFTEYNVKKQPVFHICLHSPAMTDEFYVDVLDKLLFFISRHRGVNFKYASEVTA